MALFAKSDEQIVEVVDLREDQAGKGEEEEGNEEESEEESD